MFEILGRQYSFVQDANRIVLTRDGRKIAEINKKTRHIFFTREMKIEELLVFAGWVVTTLL